MVITLPTQENRDYVKELLNTNIGESFRGQKVLDIHIDKIMNVLSIKFEFHYLEGYIYIEASKDALLNFWEDELIPLFNKKFVEVLNLPKYEALSAKLALT